MELESFATYMDLVHRDFVVELNKMRKKSCYLEEKFLVLPVVGVVAGWH